MEQFFGWFRNTLEPLVLTWAVPSYETVTSRASWCGLQAMPVILPVWPHSLRYGSVNTTGLSGGFSVQRGKTLTSKPTELLERYISETWSRSNWHVALANAPVIWYFSLLTVIVVTLDHREKVWVLQEKLQTKASLNKQSSWSSHVIFR